MGHHGSSTSTSYVFLNAVLPEMGIISCGVMQDSLSLSLVLFPPKPLCWVSAGALLGAVIKAPVLHFFDTSAWGRYHYPLAAVAVSK